MQLVSLAAAQGIALAAAAATGIKPQVINRGTYYEVAWVNPADQVAMRQFIRTQLTKPSVPGEVRINFLPVIAPLALEYLVPAVAILVLLGYVGGRYMGRRGARKIILK